MFKDDGNVIHLHDFVHVGHGMLVVDRGRGLAPVEVADVPDPLLHLPASQHGLAPRHLLAPGLLLSPALLSHRPQFRGEYCATIMGTRVASLTQNP